MSGAAISLTGLTKSFDGTPAVRDVSLTVTAGSLTALLGPSGCGKSTTLAMIGGLIAPDRGDICFDGISQLGIPADRRPSVLVFQKPLLFPHLDVERNVAFGLRMRRVGRTETRLRVAQMLDRVQLGPLAARRVGELSGGQEQRVALARALVLEPTVLLLDEPFSQLDASLRVEMRGLLRELHAENPITTVLVTHDQAEAVDVADDMALLLDGRLEGCGPTESFYTSPPSLAAARFLGVTNELTGTAHQGVFSDTVTGLRRPTSVPDGPAVLAVPPDAFTLDPPPGAGDILRGTAIAARFAGNHLAVDVRVGELLLTLHTPVGAAVPLGSSISIGLPTGRGTVFPSSDR